MWADWLSQDLLPKEDDNHGELSFLRKFSRLNDTYSQISGVKKKQGDMGSKKVRVVCENCNSGWMSALQVSARPILTSLISGNLRRFNPGEREVLASWLTMTTIVAEWSDRTLVSVTAEERHQFRELQKPLPGWTIAIGRYFGNSWWPKSLDHQAFRLTERKEDLKDILARPCNTQCTTIVAKNMVAHMMSSQVKFVVPRATGLLNRGMCIIHPPIVQVPDLHLHPILSDVDILGTTQILGLSILKTRR